ncbi:hypothetical protein FOQG_19156 [Fusarium oxysporum f. sp. raphani 54005]|uniref:Uncharacterized protein n=1 Tax=Fusarium oxysporum f. sp. raphani 54005 TaxID=1089458 RepID=X0B2V5_FUSOX|nr:hypothetical protein FOQG_19156 [Fusarium oxysporum f. sp. raphani 54005]
MSTLQLAPSKKRRSSRALNSDIPKVPRLEDECHELLPRENKETLIQHPSNATTIGAGLMEPLNKGECVPIGTANDISQFNEPTPQNLDEEDLATAVATHEERCPKTPTQDNRLIRSRYLIIKDEVWKDFQQGQWKHIAIRYIEEPLINRRYRQIREMIFPRGSTSALSIFSLVDAPKPGSAPSQDRPPPRTGDLLPGIHELFSGSSSYSHRITPAGSEPHRGIPDDRNLQRGDWWI